MQQMNRTRLFFIVGAILLASTSLGSIALAQSGPKYKVVDPLATLEGNKFKITFSLACPLDKVYDIQIKMRSADDSAYAFPLRSVTGQFGRIKFMGGRLEVFWDYKQDNPTGFSGDIYFDIEVTEVIEEGGWQWWHYALCGTGAVGVALLLIPKDSGGGGGSVIDDQHLPGPPRIQP
jgi:hypothetical protein